jgi:hypothetical protein
MGILNWLNTPVKAKGIGSTQNTRNIEAARKSFTPTPLPTPNFFTPKPAYASESTNQNYQLGTRPGVIYSDAADQAKLNAWAATQGNTGGTPTTNNGGNAGVVNNPQQGFSGTQDYSGAMQSAPEQPQIDFDALIAPALAGLDAAIGPLQQQATDTQTGIAANKATNLAANQANITGQQNVLSEAKSSQGALAENAANEARRQYAEIQQGLQSRYGGTTGTGAFAAELAGRQTLQNIGKIREGLSSAMLQIDNKLQQVQEVGRIATQDIEDKAASQIRDAKNNLDLQLADIRRQKGEIQANKASLAANAIQMYQNTVNNVNAQNASFKQNLYLSQQAAEQNLKLAQQKAQGIAQSYTPDNFSGIGKQVTPVGNVVTQTQATDQGGDLYQLLKKRFDALGTSNSPQGGVFGGL